VHQFDKSCWGTDFSRNVRNKSSGCMDFRGHTPTALSRLEIRWRETKPSINPEPSWQKNRTPDHAHRKLLTRRQKGSSACTAASILTVRSEKTNVCRSFMYIYVCSLEWVTGSTSLSILLRRLFVREYNCNTRSYKEWRWEMDKNWIKVREFILGHVNPVNKITAWSVKFNNVLISQIYA
jgi:hypothetical protein